MASSVQAPVQVHGMVAPGFEAVREEVQPNFTERKELGAACAVYYRGEKVVDLWGGVRDKTTGKPWEEDTMVLVFSSTKGMASMGWLWPIRRDCLIMMSVWQPIGRSLPRQAKQR